MHGSSTFVTDIYAGQTQQQDLGKLLAVDVMVNVLKKKPEYYSVIIVMPVTM